MSIEPRAQSRATVRAVVALMIIAAIAALAAAIFGQWAGAGTLALLAVVNAAFAITVHRHNQRPR